MRSTLLGIVLVVGLVAVAMGTMPAAPPVAPQGAAPGRIATGDEKMIVASTVVEGRYQQLVVLDPKQNSFAVYHVDLTTGRIKFCAERNVTWDLQMTHYNGEKPLPSEIQSQLEYR